MCVMGKSLSKDTTDVVFTGTKIAKGKCMCVFWGKSLVKDTTDVVFTATKTAKGKCMCVV